MILQIESFTRFSSIIKFIQLVTLKIMKIFKNKQLQINKLQQTNITENLQNDSVESKEKERLLLRVNIKQKLNLLAQNHILVFRSTSESTHIYSKQVQVNEVTGFIQPTKYKCLVVIAAFKTTLIGSVQYGGWHAHWVLNSPRTCVMAA